jgi:hypothetical protein
MKEERFATKEGRNVFQVLKRFQACFRSALPPANLTRFLGHTAHLSHRSTSFQEVLKLGFSVAL